MSAATRVRSAAARRRLAVTALVGVAAAALPVWGAPASQATRPALVDLQILSFNDFHGHLQPPSGGNGTLPSSTGSVTVGGAEYLATHLTRLREGRRNTLTVAAGDLVGGTPFLSGLFKDEPSVESLNALGLDVAGVGNHEFDGGVDELLRKQYGGCLPTGCFGEEPFPGARFGWLAANVTWRPGAAPRTPAGAEDYGSWFGDRTGRTVLPPTWVKEVDGIPVGFVGMTLEGTPELVAQAGIRDVRFGDEVRTANLAVRDLMSRGVKAIVVLLHEGGLPPAGSAYDHDCSSGAAGLSGPVVDIARRLGKDVDLVVTGHTHQAYACTLPDPAGRPRQLVSAASFGRLITETTLSLNPATGDVVRSSVRTRQHPVTRDVAPDPVQSAIIERWNALSAPIADRVVGRVAEDVTRSASRDSESALANLIADAQLAATSAAGAGGAVMAFMNPGGVRADLGYAASPAGERDGEVTYGEAFAVQPFGNLLVSMTLSGTQVDTLLEQQWTSQPDGSVRFLHLGVSDGVRYAWSASAPVGSKVDPSSITLDGVPLDPHAAYRVTVNSFLADGGDGFTVLTEGGQRVGGGVDLDALTDYLDANAHVAAPSVTRVTRLP